MRFCSARCLAHYALVPANRVGEAAARAMRPLPKARELKFEGADASVLADVAADLRGLPGVAGANCAGGRLRVAYDLRYLTLEMVEAVLNAAHLRLRGGAHRWRRDFWKFQEHNELENLARAGTGACCNRPPRLP